MQTIDLLKKEIEEKDEKLKKMTEWKDSIYSLGAAIICKMRDDTYFRYWEASDMWDTNRDKIDSKYKGLF